MDGASSEFDNSTTIMRLDDDKDAAPFDSSTTIMHSSEYDPGTTRPGHVRPLFAFRSRTLFLAGKGTTIMTGTVMMKSDDSPFDSSTTIMRLTDEGAYTSSCPSPT
jgi:hypothetical protein